MRGELERLRCDRAGERLNICERIPSSRGEQAGGRLAEGARLGVGSLGASLPALALLPLALIWFFGLFPAGQRGRVQWNSRLVGKQGERGEAKLSTRQTRLETRWREMKEIEKSEKP